MNSKLGYSYEIDIWAIGVILYAMIVGRPPFETKEVKTTYWKIQNTSYEYPEDIHISVEAKHLIDSILVFDPKDRLNLEQIRSHPFITKCHFIPSILPIACINTVIPPNKLQEFEKAPQDDIENLENIEKIYFEDRDSKDYSGHSKKFYLSRLESEDNNTTQYEILDLDELAKLPLTHRHEEEKQTKLFDNITQSDKKIAERFTKSPSKYKENKSPARVTKTSPAKSPERHLHKSPMRNTQNIEREPYLEKWVDLSQKYGFGYKLSNGCYGVLFNDGTTIISYKDTMIYIWKECDTEMRSEYTIETYPKDAKFKGLMYVKDYIDKEDNPEIIPVPWNSKFKYI
jgi:polo-like kinase 1